MKDEIASFPLQVLVFHDKHVHNDHDHGGGSHHHRLRHKLGIRQRAEEEEKCLWKWQATFYTECFFLVLKSTNQWQCLQKKYTGVFILEDQIGRFGDFDIWNKTLIVRVAWKHSGSSSRANLHAKAAWCQVFLQWKFLKLIFSEWVKNKNLWQNMFLMSIPWTFHSNRLQQHQLENHYPATTPNPLDKICKCCINFVFVLMSVVNSYNLGNLSKTF